MSNVVALADRRQPRARRLPVQDLLLGEFAQNRHAPSDVRWLKENAEYLRFCAATGLHPAGAALAGAHAETARLLPDRLAFFPQYYRFHLSIALDLDALGLAGAGAGALVRQAIANGLPQAELSDLQRAEARLFAERAGLAAPGSDPGLTARLLAFGAQAATFTLPNKKAAYELTHIVFYLTDYGTRPGAALARRLGASLLNAGLVAFLEGNTDLLAEVCLALRFCGSTPPPDWEAQVRADLRAYAIGPRSLPPGQDGYHEWLMAAWAMAAAGTPDLPEALPEGPLSFVAPARANALPGLSAALFDLGAARSADWPLMRRRLAGRLGPETLDLLDRAAASTPAFEAFFAGFVRPSVQGNAA